MRKFNENCFYGKVAITVIPFIIYGILNYA